MKNKREDFVSFEDYDELLKRNMFLSLKNASLEDKIDKAIEYTKTTLKFARLEKDFEKETILLNFLKILGDKENEE